MNYRLAWTFSIALCACSHPARAAQINYGKYFGTLQMNGHSEVLAVSLDAFVTQLNDPSTYPQLDVIVRVNLGGYFSSEYMGYEFYDPTYNFEKGVLELNDPRDDFTATLQVTNTDSQTILEGPVTQRMSGATGTMRVVMDLDNLALASQAPRSPAPFVAVLKGNYLGTCGNSPADLQIETGRDLEPSAPGNALMNYSITGRLGFSRIPGIDSDGSEPRFRSLYPYSTGSFSPYTGELVLQGPRAILNCARTGDTLQCLSHGYDRTVACTLTKAAEPATPAVQAVTGIFLDVPTEAKQPLPMPVPPGNDDLLHALSGNFYGVLHYENRDIYQLIEMDVVATTSTENPHILNQVWVEPTFLLRLGSSWRSAPVRSLFFPQRVFYLNPGFAFQSNGEDLFAVIGEWRMGYVSGVLYSRSYGRVGTFEMMKGTQPSAPVNMITMPDPSGSYQGPSDAGSPIQDLWSLTLELPNQASTYDQAAVPLVGQYGSMGAREMFGSASLDLNTGTLQFLLKDDLGNRIVEGQAVSNPGGSGTLLNLLWPPGPDFGAPMDDYSTQPFTTLSERR